MKFEITTKLGDCPIKIQEEAQDERDIFKKTTFLMNLPIKCGNCKSTDLAFTHRNIDSNDFYSIDCKQCRHTFKYGTLKNSKGLFPKGWHPPYSQSQQGESA